MTGDLPLFEWRPPEADVVPFPAARRIAWIRRTAARIVDYQGSLKGDQRAQNYLDEMLRRQSKSMWKCGLDESQIDDQLSRLGAAVVSEVQRLHLVGRRAR